MATKLEIYRTSGSGWTDYSDWLLSNRDSVVKKSHALNNPQLLEFSLQNGTPSFLLPEAGNRARYTTDSYGVTFIGYLLATPELELLGKIGSSPVYGYACRAVSEEQSLEWKTASVFSTRPPFVNKYQGIIIKELISELGGGLTTTNVDNGILIPFFRLRPEEGFWDAVRRLSDRTNMKFWTKNGAAYYKSYTDTGFGYSPSETDIDTKFDPFRLSVKPAENGVFNDVVGFGTVEPQAYVREYFIGDGFTDRFSLKFPVYSAQSSMLLEDDFAGTSIDANRWTETDVDGILGVSSNSLVFSGGNVGAASRLTANQGLEISGKLELRAGRIRFNAVSDCIIGGVFSSDTGALAQCIAGFRATPVSGSTVLQAIVSGALAGPTYTVQSGKTYQFVLSIDSDAFLRRRREFFSIGQSFGGEDIASGADFTFTLTELPDSESDRPTIVLSHTASIASVQTFLYYTLLAGPVTLANSVNLVLNFCALRKAIMAALWAKLLGGSWALAPLGDKADATARAAIVAGTEGHDLVFFNDGIPAPQEKIALHYFAADVARARVRRDSSITAEAAKAGDSGVRAGYLPDTQPAPRDSAEVERAIQAFIDDHTGDKYAGDWTFDTKTYGTTTEPVPGRIITVNSTTRYPQFTALVTSVESRFLVKDGAAEIIDHTAEFGPIWRLENIQRDFETPDEALKGPFDSTKGIASVEFNSVGASYAADRPDVYFTETLTASTAEMDASAAPTSSYEVRKTDAAWGTASTLNLISTPATQLFTVPRNVRDIIIYLKNKDGAGLVSRYPAVVRIVYPLVPNAPTATVDGSDRLHPLLKVTLPADATDVYGIEIRDTDNATVLYKYGDLSLSFAVANDPALTYRWDNTVSLTRTKTFYVYTWNLAGEYSSSYQLDMSLGAPSIQTVFIDALNNLITWLATVPAALTPQDILYDVQVDTTGNATYTTLEVNIADSADPYITVAHRVVASPFDIRIRAKDQIGAGDWLSLHHDGVTPPNVISPSVTEDGITIDGHLKSRVTCSWTNPSNEDYAGVAIYIKGYQAINDWRLWFTKDRSITSFKDTIEKTGETVYFAFVSFDQEQFRNTIASSPGGDSSIYVALDGNDSAPNAPTGLAWRPQPGAIEISWNENTEDDIESYEVHRSSNGSDYSLIATVYAAYGTTAGTASFMDAVGSWVTRYYKLKAVDKGGNKSGFSSAVTANSQYDVPEGDNIIPNSRFQDWDNPAGETALRWSKKTYSGSATFSQVTAPGGGQFAQQIALANTSAQGTIISDYATCRPGMWYILGQEVYITVGLSSGSRFRLYLWNADRTSSVYVSFGSGSTGSGTQTNNIWILMPASGATQIGSSLGTQSITGTLNFDPCWAQIETGAVTPSAATTYKFTRVIFAELKDPNNNVPLNAPATNNAVFAVTNAVISWNAFTIYLGGSQGNQISVSGGSISGLSDATVYVLYYDITPSTGGVKQTTSLLSSQLSPNIVLGVASTKCNTPGTPSLSAVAYTGGPAVTYYVKTQYVRLNPDVDGDVSAYQTQAVSADQTVKVTSPGGSGNAGYWNVYISTAIGKEIRRNLNPLPFVDDFTYVPYGAGDTGTQSPSGYGTKASAAISGMPGGGGSDGLGTGTGRTVNADKAFRL